MFSVTNSVETSKVFIKNTFPNIICRKSPRIWFPFKNIIKNVHIINVNKVLNFFCLKPGNMGLSELGPYVSAQAFPPVLF